MAPRVSSSQLAVAESETLVDYHSVFSAPSVDRPGPSCLGVLVGNSGSVLAVGGWRVARGLTGGVGRTIILAESNRRGVHLAAWPTRRPRGVDLRRGRDYALLVAERPPAAFSRRRLPQQEKP